MNLFENLQLMKESDTSIVSEFREFLSNKNAQYIANEIDETRDGMQLVIYDGDWKHEHLYMKHLLDEFFTNKGIDISITSEEIGESDQDTYSARYDIEFNPESKEYMADVVTEDVDTSSWKQRFKGMDVYISDKYPNYQIKKSYTSSKQEVWQVLNFRTQREVFVSGTFEGAVKWVEDKDVSKSEALDNMEEGKYYGGAYDISDTAYFTRDDLDEFSNEVIEQLSNATHADIIADVVDCYLDEDTNELELTLSYNEYEHTHKEKIDMRKIKTPKDLIKAYSYKFVNDFLWNFMADAEHEELIKEDYNSDNAATFLNILEDEIENAAKKYMISKCGFSEDEVDDYLTVTTDVNDDAVVIHVGAELSYESLYGLGEELNKIIEVHDKDAYFEPEIPGRLVAYLFGIKNESIDKLEESNHNEILDKDYATGEKIYNALVEYLNSLDQIGMDGKDCNWEPSNFNAKNLNADGEIYLVSGAYILIYPYINEWAEDYFKVCVVEADELSIQIKNGIENIVNKFKTNKWKLVFEG